MKKLKCSQTKQACCNPVPNHTSLNTAIGEPRPDDQNNPFIAWKRDLFQSGKLADVTLEVDGTTFQAHKLVLASGSPVFEAMFAYDMTEKLQSHVKIEEMRVGVFQRMLEYIYTGKIEDMDAVTAMLVELVRAR